MTDVINFIHSEKYGTLVEVKGNLVDKKYISVKDMMEMLRIYNGAYLKNKLKVPKRPTHKQEECTV